MITASIVTYKHTFEDIKLLVQSIISSPIIILYIIDHSPEKCVSTLQEDITAYLTEQNALIKLIYIRQENKGYSGGHNLALQDAIKHGASYHLVVNPDVYFDRKVIPAIFTYMEENPDVGQLMPKVLYATGELQRLCKLIPEPMDLLGRFILPNFFLESRNKKFELADTGYKKIMNVPYLSGCFMFFRLSALQDVGLMDEHFFMYAEDIDITRRIHEKYKTIYYPKVSITHLFNRADRRSMKLLCIHIVNIIKYFNKWGWFKDEKRDFYNKQLLSELKKGK